VKGDDVGDDAGEDSRHLSRGHSQGTGVVGPLQTGSRAQRGWDGGLDSTQSAQVCG
jgi:hypothetical protein